MIKSFWSLNLFNLTRLLVYTLPYMKELAVMSFAQWKFASILVRETLKGTILGTEYNGTI